VKTMPARQLRKVLLQMGLKPCRGNGTGHEIWSDGTGRICHPVLRKKDCPYQSLFVLASEMVTKGIIVNKHVLLSALKAA
jgi:hypothetical protein